MVKIGSLLTLFMLFASLGFAWTTGYEPPSCITQYSILGVNFTLTTNNTQISCSTPSWFTSIYLDAIQGTYSSNVGNTVVPSNASVRVGNISQYLTVYATSSGSVRLEGNKTNATISVYLPRKTGENISLDIVTSGDGGTPSVNITSSSTLEPTPRNRSITTLTTTNIFAYTIVWYSGGLWTISNGTANFTTTENKISFNTTASYWMYTGDGHTIEIRVNTNTTGGETSAPAQMENSTYQFGDYKSLNGATILRSDFKTFTTAAASTTGMCRVLLYFNNPYYGNIQLVPKITYIPGANAFSNFVNSTDNSAYIPNNTISYVFDSITGIWYIVPAYTCINYTIVGSTSTLQYDPTATGNIGGGTVPIDVYINGSCSYNTANRVVTCTGIDSSATVTSLNLSTYALGNTTPNCANGTAGASATLTCTIPNVNGTYYAYFYGTDANLINHLFAYKEIMIGSSTTTYGRDGYLVAILLAVVASTLITSSIAVSMVLGCFGLFVALAFGIVPIDGNAVVAVLLMVVAFVLSYRLKV